MRTAAKVLLFLTMLVAHKAFVNAENRDKNIDEIVQRVNHSITSLIVTSKS